ncbi:phloretin 4'-O-glucosyltransferase-like [Vicia villosa]|uniref:phloretin 4'-O-glucosyltransferase-like n=1 Tax=Vicia villosa TaxID=3911 RepID=UPI00273C3EF3|nr:phloretin 4'-O-glucosyltransferase-like [Vicia villosa]
MAATHPNHRFLIISYPIQGHINPALQLAKRLATLGANVTFATTIYLHSHLVNKPTTPGLSFATFSDGYDDGLTTSDDKVIVSYVSELTRRGSEFLKKIILSAKEENHPFTCLTYSILLPWAAKVARELHLPSVLLWIQAATVFDIYYHYFHEHGEYIKNISEEAIELPGLPFSLKKCDIPSFLLASSPYTFALPSVKEHIQILEEETNPRILVNTVEEFEYEALREVDVGKIEMIPIGPLIPSAFLDGKDPLDTSFGGDVISVDSEDDYLKWLDSKDELSVVYVSFGTLAVLSKRQMEEIARGLLDSGFSFLWVIRDTKSHDDNDELSCREELERNVNGKIVKWCCQVEVLSHSSIGCFVTHCGWNSTLESLGSGVPMVAFPQWTDQTTNAKLIEDVWGSGVRMVCDEEGIVKAEEIRRYLDVVMGKGEKGEELRRNAKKLKSLAREAVKEGGSSDKNLRRFLDDIGCVSES